MTLQHDNLQRQLSQYKSELKIAKNEKAKIAVQFKNAIAGSNEHAALIQSMQAVSANVKAIEQKLKEIEREILAATEVRQSDITILPPLLTISEQHNWNDGFSIREINTDEFPKWDKFVQAIPNATAYHQAAWRDLIASSFNNPTRIWVALDANNNIIGGIPLTFFNSRLFGSFAVSVPYVNYGGVISTYFNVAQKLLDHLSSICKSEQLSHIEVRTMQPNLANQASSKKASMILALPKTDEELDKDLGSKIRAQQKKAEEHNPTIAFGKIELVNDFYEVFAKNMRDLGTPVYSKNWFSAILNNSAVQSTLVVVYVNKKPVSAGFLIGHNGMLEIPWASTIKEANALNTNMWMYRKILDYAINKNFNFFDFGRSTQEAGTYKFKKQWGSVPYLHYWYKILPDSSASVPELNPDNPKFSLMIKVWKMLPVWFTKIIGPFIIKNIP